MVWQHKNQIVCHNFTNDTPIFSSVQDVLWKIMGTFDDYYAIQDGCINYLTTFCGFPWYYVIKDSCMNYLTTVSEFSVCYIHIQSFYNRLPVMRKVDQFDNKIWLMSGQLINSPLASECGGWYIWYITCY